MKLIANIIWAIFFGGWFFSLLTAFLGLLICATVVGLPIGIGLLNLARLYLWPFGHQLVDAETLDSKRPLIWRGYSLFVKILYIPLGLVLSICSISAIIGYTITILGFPVALVFFKSFGAIWNPVNKVYV